MKRTGFVVLLVVLTLTGVRSSAEVQAKPATAAAQSVAAVSPVTLKVTIVISRFQGEKKIGNLPFVLMVVPGSLPPDGTPPRDGDPVSIQVGSQYPYPSTTVTDGKAVASTKWESLGTNINAMARTVAEGHYNVYVAVQDSQIASDPTPATGLPRFQSFRSTNRLILRDGQTVQYTAGADKMSGEIIKLDVTLNVLK